MEKAYVTRAQPSALTAPAAKRAPTSQSNQRHARAAAALLLLPLLHRHPAGGQELLRHRRQEAIQGGAQQQEGLLYAQPVGGAIGGRQRRLRGGRAGGMRMGWE